MKTMKSEKKKYGVEENIKNGFLFIKSYKKIGKITEIMMLFTAEKLSIKMLQAHFNFVLGVSENMYNFLLTILKKSKNIILWFTVFQ